MPTVAERLRALRAVGEAADIPRRTGALNLRSALQRQRSKGAGVAPGNDEDALARLTGGSVSAPGLVVVHERLPLEYRHGEVALAGVDGLPACALGVPSQAAEQPLVFLDTETTGLAGGSGTMIFMLGLVLVRGAHLDVRQYLLAGPRGERPMLEQAAAALAGGAILVTYNGLAFDLPLLAARSRIAGCTDAFGPLQQLDLVGLVRRAFRRRWPDCRLQTAESQLLGLRRQGDLPGCEAPAAWLRWLRAGDSSSLSGVLRHNRMDLLSLVALGIRLASVYASPAEHPSADWACVARALLRRGERRRAFECLSTMEATLDEEGLLLLAELYRRNAAWDEALAIWKRLAGQGCAAAHLALAKHYEHVRRDYSMALNHTDALLRVLGPRPELLHRRQRLNTRRARSRHPGPHRWLELAECAASAGHRS